MPIIDWLLDTSMGAPGPHGQWPLWLSATFHIANLAIAACDFAIPLIIVRLWRYRREGVTARQLWAALGFLPAVGVTRLLRAAEVFGPPYHLTALIDAAAAILSVACALRVAPFVRHVLALPSRDEIHAAKEELHVELLRRQVAEQELTAAIAVVTAKLERAKEELDRLQLEKSTAAWWRGRTTALDEISRDFDRLRKEN